MSYVPNSAFVYTAAFCGAMAGMSIVGRQPVESDPADYADFTEVAGAFAQEFDTVWDSSGNDSLDVFMAQLSCQGFWVERLPTLAQLKNPLSPATYSADCHALIAALDQSSTFFAAQGITPPAFGGVLPPGGYWTTQSPISAADTTPMLVQAPATSDVVPQNLLISAQDAFSGAVTHQIGGNLIISSGAATTPGQPAGKISFKLGSTGDDVLYIDGTNGITVSSEAFSAPEYVISTISQSITGGSSIPGSASAVGSLYLFNNAYNGLYSWNGTAFAPLAQLDASGHKIIFDPTDDLPGISQPPNPTAGGVPMRFVSQAAHTGSTTQGGDMSFILGANDPPGEYPATNRLFWFGMETALGGTEPLTNYTNLATLAWNSGGAVIFNLGRGSNAVGAGVAGNEISGFAEISIATENFVPVNIIIAGTGPTSVFVEIMNHDTTDEAAMSLAYFANHPTGGDVAGLQILYTETAIGTGTARLIDFQKGGVRIGSIRPYSAGGINIVADSGYLALTPANAVLMAPGTAIVQMANSGVLGFNFLFSGVQSILSTLAANTSFALQQNGTQGLVLEAFTNIAIGSIAGSYGGGKGVVFIANDNTDPTSNPVGGGLLYVAAGALKYRGTGGTVTTLGAA